MSAPIPIVFIDPAEYSVPQDVVKTQITDMANRADRALAASQAAIAQLAAWQPPDEPAPPNLQPPQVQAPSTDSVPLPAASDVGTTGQFTEPAFEDFTSLIDAVDDSEIPTFTPAIDSLYIPPAPAPLDTGGAPQRPTIVAPAVPAAPDAALPAEPALLALTLPDAPTLNLPSFDTDVPLFDAVLPNVVLDWREPEYHPLLQTELAATIKAMLAGGFAMPAVVQDALVAAARAREDVTAHKAVQDATDACASRGFQAPPGMLEAELSATRQQNQLQANALSRDVFTKAAEWAIENLRQAVAQGIALEGALLQQFNAMAQRVFEAARARLQATLDTYNLEIAAHNAKLASINALAQVFSTKVQAELSRLQEYRARIEAEALKGTINEQMTRMYATRVQALQVLMDRYRTLLQGVQITADLEKSKIDLYRADVQAWGEKIAADKTRFDAYKTQVEGETSKAQMLDAQARAFAATVQAFESKNNIKIAATTAKLRAIETSVTKFTALVGAEREKITADLGVLQARTQTLVADTQRYTAQTGAVNQRAELQVRAAEATAQNNIAYFNVLSHQFDARMQRVLQEAITMQDILKSIAAMTSQLAAGAMSATHVQASISNSASTSLGASQSYSAHADVSDID